MLDVIVTDNRPYSAAYHDRCVDSVRQAIAQAGFEARLVEAPGNLKAIAKARGEAFDRTTAPYVTWVVDFDYLLPDALAALAPHFTDSPAAIFTRELRESPRGLTKFPSRHHLAVYRRDVVEAVRDAFNIHNVNVTTPLLRKTAGTLGRTVDVLHWGYVRNVTPEVNDIYRSEIVL